jgi:hypothetical protein
MHAFFQCVCISVRPQTRGVLGEDGLGEPILQVKFGFQLLGIEIEFVLFYEMT